MTPWAVSPIHVLGPVCELQEGEGGWLSSWALPVETEKTPTTGGKQNGEQVGCGQTLDLA